MNERPPDIVIPDRASFKATEVCELLKVQPYVLRSWESEFRDLGVAKVAGGPRIYRRSDVERALRIKQYVFGEGLTLAGARRRLEQEMPAEPMAEADDEVSSAAVPDPRLREGLVRVRAGLRDLLGLLSAGSVPTSRSSASAAPEFVLEPPRLADEGVPSPAGSKGVRRRREPGGGAT